MPRRRIYKQERHAHFVTFSCYKRRRLLDHDAAKRVVLGCLNAQLRRLPAGCAGFVIIPQPLARVVLVFRRCTGSRIAGALEAVEQSADQEPLCHAIFSICRAHPARGSRLAGEVLRLQRLQRREGRREASIYAPDPVKAGLVESAVDWPWSSARYYELGRSVGVPIARLE